MLKKPKNVKFWIYFAQENMEKEKTFKFSKTEQKSLTALTAPMAQKCKSILEIWLWTYIT